MILCITPNPALDRTIVLPRLVLGDVHRAEKAMVAAGGKGLNVARTVRTLGGEPLCMGFAGGNSGRLLADLAQNEGLNSSWTWTDSETRSCTILISMSGDATVINESGTPVSSSDWKRLQEDVHQKLPSVSFVCLSGSLPPQSSAEQLQRLLNVLVDSGKQVWVDTSGMALKTALAYPHLCIKVNSQEIGAAFGMDVNSRASAKQALVMLNQHGRPASIITLGSAGALLATKRGRWHAQGLLVEVVSSVGSGDAFLGGPVTALEAGKDWPAVLRDAVAAGTANTLFAGGGQFAYQDFDDIRKQIHIQTW